MDAQAKKKALYRAKLNAQKQEKRLDSPLVRYNEQDQLVCRVCNVVLKSESQWPAHQASRKHQEAINNLKANAAAASQANSAKPEPSNESAQRKSEREQEFKSNKIEISSGLAKPRASSNLPSDFFDNVDSKKQKTERNVVDPIVPGGKVDTFPKEKGEPSIEIQPETATVSESKQAKGVLPAGFFDNKDADMLARGIVPVKPDVKDEYKEFEKSIQPDLQKVDSRMEEEEFDAAEMIEEAVTVDQRTFKEGVELLRKKRMELKAARSAGNGKIAQVSSKETTANEKSSSDDDSDEDFKVDWRAKHL